jgi:hypothetical protein
MSAFLGFSGTDLSYEQWHGYIFQQGKLAQEVMKLVDETKDLISQ